jgi:peptidoglycan pentaglycine glycine transferase (the first glycine)
MSQLAGIDPLDFSYSFKLDLPHFRQAMQERWPEIQIHNFSEFWLPVVGDSHKFSGTILEEQHISLSAQPEEFAEFCIWYRSYVPANIPLMAWIDYGFYYVMTANTTEEEIKAALKREIWHFELVFDRPDEIQELLNKRLKEKWTDSFIVDSSDKTKISWYRKSQSGDWVIGEKAIQFLEGDISFTAEFALWCRDLSSKNLRLRAHDTYREQPTWIMDIEISDKETQQTLASRLENCLGEDAYRCDGIYLSRHTALDRKEWNAALRALPHTHILQTWEWGEFKRATTGWQPLRLAFKREGEVVAMVSMGIRRVGPLKVMYAPKGPVMPVDDAEVCAFVLDYLQNLARKQFAIWLKIDPDVIAATGVPGDTDDTPNQDGQPFVAALKQRGWRFSDNQVQFRNTITLDLTQSEDELLAAMSQSTRRKVRLAEREGVTVRAATLDDLPTLYKLYQETGERDHFLVRPDWYYEQVWRKFMEAGLAHALIAEYEGKPIAHVILFHFGRKCWYFYGASSNEERQRMPNYLLQWEAMRWAKAQGYATYDMWGAPDVFDESDSMWGVYNFKRGFRGTVTRHIGAWDYAPYSLLYAAYTKLWPRVLGWMRQKRGYNNVRNQENG